MKNNYLLDIDFNTIYTPTIMSQFKLPIGDFTELNQTELEEFQNQDLMQVDVISGTDYYICSDIKTC